MKAFRETLDASSAVHRTDSVRRVDGRSSCERRRLDPMEWLQHRWVQRMSLGRNPSHRRLSQFGKQPRLDPHPRARQRSSADVESDDLQRAADQRRVQRRSHHHCRNAQPRRGRGSEKYFWNGGAQRSHPHLSSGLQRQLHRRLSIHRHRGDVCDLWISGGPSRVGKRGQRQPERERRSSRARAVDGHHSLPYRRRLRSRQRVHQRAVHRRLLLQLDLRAQLRRVLNGPQRRHQRNVLDLDPGRPRSSRQLLALRLQRQLDRLPQHLHRPCAVRRWLHLHSERLRPQEGAGHRMRGGRRVRFELLRRRGVLQRRLLGLLRRLHRSPRRVSQWNLHRAHAGLGRNPQLRPFRLFGHGELPCLVQPRHRVRRGSLLRNRRLPGEKSARPELRRKQ